MIKQLQRRGETIRRRGCGSIQVLRGEQMTERLDLDGIEARCEAATPGPWTMRDGWGFTDESMRCERVAGAEQTTVLRASERTSCLEGRREDFEFIARARTDIPALIARVRELEKALDAVILITGQTLYEARHLLDKDQP